MELLGDVGVFIWEEGAFCVPLSTMLLILVLRSVINLGV